MNRTAPPAALILGGAGLIPFVGLSALVILGQSLSKEGEYLNEGSELIDLNV